MKIHQRILNSDPWKSINESIEALIDKIILEANPIALDDDIPDLLDDWDNRLEAIEILKDKLLKMLNE